MNRIACVLLFGLFLSIGFNATAQKQKKGKSDTAVSKTKPKKFYVPQVYLGDSKQVSGSMAKDELSRLMREGLSAHDSLGNAYTVTGFMFGYSERMLYEDSVGNLVVMTDYLSDYCPGNKLPESVSSSIYDRMKAGDTVHFNQVTLRRNAKSGGENGTDLGGIAGRGLKFLIVK